MIENFVVHYHGADRPSIKGNSFDGLEIDEYREEAEEFISFVNSIINKNNQLEERIVSLLESEEKLLIKERIVNKLARCICGGEATNKTARYAIGYIACAKCGIRTKERDCDDFNYHQDRRKDWNSIMVKIKESDKCDRE
jgi:hypothetical protein